MKRLGRYLHYNWMVFALFIVENALKECVQTPAWWFMRLLERNIERSSRLTPPSLLLAIYIPFQLLTPLVLLPLQYQSAPTPGFFTLHISCGIEMCYCLCNEYKPSISHTNVNEWTIYVNEYVNENDCNLIWTMDVGESIMIGLHAWWFPVRNLFMRKISPSPKLLIPLLCHTIYDTYLRSKITLCCHIRFLLLCWPSKPWIGYALDGCLGCDR